MLYCRWLLSCILLIISLPVSSAPNIPAELFFQAPAISSLSLNISGDKIATTQNTNGSSSVTVINTSTLEEIHLFDTAEHNDKETFISDHIWIDEHYLAIQLSETRTGIQDLLSTHLSHKLLIFDTSKPSEPPYTVKTSGWIVDAIAEEPGQFIYAKSGISSKLYRLKVEALSRYGKKLGKLDRIDGGQFKPGNEIKSTDGYVTRWFFKENKPHSSLRVTHKEQVQLITFTESGENIIKQWSPKNTAKSKTANDDGPLSKRLVPLSLAENPNEYYCLDFNEENERSVYKVNYYTNQVEKIYETSAYKIVNIFVDQENKFLGVHTLRDGTVTLELNDFVEKIDATNRGRVNSIVSDSQHSDYRIVFKSSHNSPGQYLLENKKTKSTSELAKRYSGLPTSLKSQQIIGTKDVSGLKIPFILNTPLKNATFNPLIVMPHGGPIGVFDSPYYDPVTQYMVHQGFSVLRINHRGSSGHSDELKEAGKKQWGGKILEDIYEVTNYVTNEFKYKKSTTCFFGMSYGAYATVSLLSQHNEFKCGVAIAGVYDLNLYLNERERPLETRKWLINYVGDTSSEREALIKISPVYNIKNLSAPVFIIHGEEDDIVDIEHSYRLKLALEKDKKAFEWLAIPDLGHSLGAVDTAAMIMDKSLSFIEASISKK